MKKAIGIFFLFLLSVVLYEVISYSTYGAPAEFGNASLTTCYVGGDLGIINCTGNITTTNGVFVGDGSALSNIVIAESDPKWSANFTNMIVDCPTGNYSYGVNTNGSLKCRDDADTISVGADNCSAEGSCGLIAYDTEFQNDSVIRSPNTSWITNNQNLIANCSVDQSCDNVLYTTDDTGNTTLDIEAVCYSNVTKGEWITPSYVIDIDKEDIETDLNTFVDIGGNEEMTGPFNVSGARTQFKSEDGDGKIAVIIDGDGEATDYPLVIRAGSTPSTLGYSDRVCTVNHVGDVNCSKFYGTEFYLNDVAISTTHTEIRASILTNVSDANDSMKIYVDAKDVIYNTSMVTHVESTNTSMKSYVDEFKSLADDTSPQLGGYLDANGNNIGSTSDEIENIYIGVNTKLYLGDGQEGEVYFDGSKLIIKVN